jgi:signal transduction histidine kinase
VSTTRAEGDDAEYPSGAPDIDVERFVAAVSHDLESSLLVLTSNLEMLRAGGRRLSAEQEDHLARIERTTKRMRRLLSSVRNYAWANADLELGTVPLEEVVNDSVEMVAAMIEERAAKIRVDNPLPTVTGDRDQLVQLFQNLLSNAVKFGPQQGQIVITAARNGGNWRIKIADEGPGISPQNYDRVFEPFRRLRGTGHIQGTGLGLTICLRVARNHGGSLTVEPAESGGAAFVLTLPDRRIDEPTGPDAGSR